MRFELGSRHMRLARRRRRLVRAIDRVAIAAILWSSLPAPSLGLETVGQEIPIGDLVAVGTTAVGVDSLGRFLVVWAPDPSQQGVRGRILSPEGVLLGEELVIGENPGGYRLARLAVSSSRGAGAFDVSAGYHGDPNPPPPPFPSPACLIATQRVSAEGELEPLQFEVLDHEAISCADLGSVQILADDSSLVTYDHLAGTIAGRDAAYDRRAADGSVLATFAPFYDEHPDTAGDQFDPAVSYSAQGGVVAWWEDSQIRGLTFDHQVQVREESPIAIGSTGPLSSIEIGRPAVGIDDMGRFAVAWTAYGDDGTLDVWARSFGADGAPLRPPFRVNDTTAGDQHGPSLAMTGAGEWVVAWRSDAPEARPAILAKSFGAAGAATSLQTAVSELYDPERTALPSIAIAETGIAVVTWGVVGHYVPFEVVARRLALATPGTCTNTPTRLCLTGRRFSVTMQYATSTGASGPAHLVPGTIGEDSGLFWFFAEDNWEVLVKVLDGCWYNSRFWVFLTAASDVELWVTVRDTLTGEEWTHHKPQGVVEPPTTDTDAFATCPD